MSRWVCSLLAFLAASVAAQEPPREALRYQRALTTAARSVWGLSAPVATFAGQIQQESAWRERAQSPYAQGLAQFTPDTARWISGLYPDLAGADVWNPQWAILALVRYDRWLWDRLSSVPEQCDRMAMTLAGYNGGAGWIDRERAKARSAGLDASRWWGHVETVCLRAQWACTENRDYPRRILHRHEPVYRSWGAGSCSDSR